MESFKKTTRQVDAIDFLCEKARHCMLYGGGRSGKTFILCYALIIRALKTKSRHVILRLKFNHVKTSIWLDTLPKVLKLCFKELPVKWHGSDFYISLPNGSQIWIAGLDDKDRTEKILGTEFSTLYFNECSQIPYDSITKALTRLAEKNSLTKKAYYDENPPSKKHWSYWLFVKHINPISDEPISPSNYRCFLMNPTDNSENIDPSYIEEILQDLPEKERKRFLLGEFIDADDGLVYYSFNREDNVESFDEPFYQKWIGQDFNVDPGAAVIGFVERGKLFICNEVFMRNSDTYKVSDELIRMGYIGSDIVPDSTGKARRTSGTSDHAILKDKGFKVHYSPNPAVRDRVNNLNRLFEQGKIVIHPRCKKLITDLDRVTWDKSDIDKKIDPMLTHISDALGYLAWKLYPIRRKYGKEFKIQLS